MDTKKLDLNLLLTLEALLAEQNVTRAAHRLCLSQPAVSAQLSRLRELFNDPLLIPGRRGVTPTAKALELMVPLREALEKIRYTVHSHEAFDPRHSSLTVNLSCTDYVQSALIIPLMLALRDSAPEMKLAIRNYDPGQTAAQLASGEVDLVIATPDPDWKSQTTCHLFNEHYVLVGAKDNPGLTPDLTMAQFAALEHIVVSPEGGGFITPVDALLQASGLQRKTVMSAASFLFIPGMVAISNLVALVPARLIQPPCDHLSVIPLAWLKNDFEVSLIWHQRTQGHAGYRWLREKIISLFTCRSGASL